jgi:hypothetical protein
MIEPPRQCQRGDRHARGGHRLGCLLLLEKNKRGAESAAAILVVQPQRWPRLLETRFSRFTSSPAHDI